MTKAGVWRLGMAIGLCLLPVGTWRARAQPPMPVTSDTPEYCGQLEHRIRQQPNLPAAAKQLLKEGHQQCDHGQVRLGIAHLRRALLLLKHGAPPPP
jgi:hypothetical protein